MCSTRSKKCCSATRFRWQAWRRSPRWAAASIPLVTQRLSERLRAPVVTTPQSQLNVAAGAALPADRGLSADAPTGIASAADAPTDMATAAWAAGAAGMAAEVGRRRRQSATFRALAWSQDDAPTDEPVLYAGEDYNYGFDQGSAEARPQVAFGPGEKAIRPSRHRCPGTNARRSCSAPRPPRRCSRSAALSSP